MTKLVDLGTTDLWLQGISPARSPIRAGRSTTGTVTLSGPAPAGGVVVVLDNRRPDIITSVPASVTIPAGQSSASFSIGTSSNLAQGWTGRAGAMIVASFGGTSHSTILEVDYSSTTSPAPTWVDRITMSGPRVGWGSTIDGVVIAAGPAPSGGAVVTLATSDVTVATVPATVIVPAGATSAPFTITTRPTATPTETTIGIHAAYGGAARPSSVVVTSATAAVATSLTLSQSSVTGGSRITGTVFLDGPAGPEGAVVTSRR